MCVLVDKHQFESVFHPAGIIGLPNPLFGTKISVLKTYASEKKSYFVLFYIKNLPIWIKDIV